ncbi:hypothetical protein ScPMuIL_017720 [Solemya velum]
MYPLRLSSGSNGTGRWKLLSIRVIALHGIAFEEFLLMVLTRSLRIFSSFTCIINVEGFIVLNKNRCERNLLTKHFFSHQHRFSTSNLSRKMEMEAFETNVPVSKSETDNPTSVNEIQEGKARVDFPNSVFYNPVQEFNRDLTIAMISQYAKNHFDKINTAKSSSEEMGDAKVENNHGNGDFSKLEAGKYHENGIRILEGLSASGLRSMRFGLEVPGVKEVVSNDFDRTAVEFIERNIQKNGLEGIVRSNCDDAAMVMYQNKHPKTRFDVIDLDPYGSPAPFLDAAVQAVKDGGLLCVTCTDTAVLCGNAGETCYAKYGAMSLKGKFCHEMGLRIILQCLESHANRYSRYIVPLLSLSVDFYVRVFIKVLTGQAKVKRSVSKMAMVYHCVGCGSFSLQKLGLTIPTKGGNFKYTPAIGPPVSEKCSHCGFHQQLGGPMWGDQMHDVDFIKTVISSVEKTPGNFKTAQRIIGMLSLAAEELHDTPLYYITDELCNVVHCTPPGLIAVRSALLNAGYRVSLSHAAKNSQKTDAPTEFIWDIMRAWVKKHPVREDRLAVGTPAKAILEKTSTSEVSFEEHPQANPHSRKEGMLRWQHNPEKDWGPKPRAKKTQDGENKPEKREQNQGRRRKRQADETIDLKKYPCKHFKKGKCRYGDKCVYGHSVENDDKLDNDVDMDEVTTTTKE